MVRTRKLKYTNAILAAGRDLNFALAKLAGHYFIVQS
jgi:hypothetical protein